MCINHTDRKARYVWRGVDGPLAVCVNCFFERVDERIGYEPRPLQLETVGAVDVSKRSLSLDEHIATIQRQYATGNFTCLELADKHGLNQIIVKRICEAIS